ncbi:hypothetical protein [Tellurirhabdus rosea]|uniref:hypothetical protein n=1 Tax=Tellurirhabdus rosea TaxID=2674997 RepID=UPI0022546B62|nr:hypothetical protein [Tellurirhabdus rosea]
MKAVRYCLWFLTGTWLTFGMPSARAQNAPRPAENAVKADRIYLRDNSVIEALITEVTEKEVRYRKMSNPTGPIFSQLKERIAVVVYANGESESFTASTTPGTPAPPEAGSEAAPETERSGSANQLVLTKLSGGRQYTFKAGDEVRLKNDDDSYGGNFSSYRILGVTRETLLLTAGGTEYNMPFRNITGIKHKQSNALQNILRFGGALAMIVAGASQGAKADQGSYTYNGYTYYENPLTWEVPVFVTGSGMLLASLVIKKPYLKFNKPGRFKWQVVPKLSNH